MEWDELILKYPHNMDIQMLHAVRIGLCKKIDDGPVDFNMAKYAFNRLHEVVVKRANQAKRLGIILSVLCLYVSINNVSQIPPNHD